MLTGYDKNNLGDILMGHGDWFAAKLLRTIAHADLHNRSLLFKGFPEEVHLVNTYNWGKDNAETWRRKELDKAAGV